jgi:uncharacterized membrane protein
MNLIELLIVLLVGLLVLGMPLITFVLAIIAFTRSKEITKLSIRVASLESQLRSGTQLHEGKLATIDRDVSSLPNDSPVLAATAMPQTPWSESAITGSLTPNAVATPLATATASREGNSRTDESSGAEPIGWETFVGQKAFGWTAVLLFVLSAAFFLRYAFQNNWIGPVGRVAIGELVGITLAGAGVYYFRKGLIRFSSMMTAAGIVVLYLSTYSAFGFYQLLPQTHAGAFLAILIFESMLAAVIYRSVAVALAAVIGGLLTPILLSSAHDTYWSFFTYLAILNFGVVIASLYRRWPAVASVSLLGSQWLYWMWYASQYHPEKFIWAIGFQVVLFLLYLIHGVCKTRAGKEPMDREELVRFAVNALFAVASFHILLREDHRVWLGTVALAMAAIYAGAARLALKSPSGDQRLLLTSLALALGFIAWALPLQANTGWDALLRWIALGWAVIGLALWLFGLRISSLALRVMAAVFVVLAACRLLINDLPFYVREPFIPVLNDFALPAVLTAVCILYGVVSTRKRMQQLSKEEQALVGWTGVLGVMLLWIVLSFDCYGYFVSQSLFGGEIDVWRWRGQLALTVFWAFFATILLVIGFRMDRSKIRWLAIALYVTTVIKLFLFDMANVQQIYRILAFFVLAVVLGLVARAYQRFK